MPVRRWVSQPPNVRPANGAVKKGRPIRAPNSSGSPGPAVTGMVGQSEIEAVSPNKVLSTMTNAG